MPISRDRVHNLMRRMGLRAIYQKPRTTVPGSPSERVPCLVDLNKFTSIDQVWATDITYIPMRKGFLYLVAIVDLISRNILSWKLSNSLDTQFCMEALEMALASGSRPEIFHSDQGCQFTSTKFVGRLQAEDIKISWSGRRHYYDNILVERLWRTVKYEEVYLRAYSDGSIPMEVSTCKTSQFPGVKTPHETYSCIENRSSSPGLMMSEAKTVQ
jgi:putative transposase